MIEMYNKIGERQNNAGRMRVRGSKGSHSRQGRFSAASMTRRFLFRLLDKLLLAILVGVPLLRVRVMVRARVGFRHRVGARV